MSTPAGRGGEPRPTDVGGPEAGATRGGAEASEERCEGLRVDPQRGGHHRARCGGREVALVLATREDPQRFRPPVALWRLAQALGLGVVPRTEARAIPLGVLLGAMDDEAQRQQLGRELAVEANGRVSAAVIELPPGTRHRATRWSHEEKLWSGLAESSGALAPDQQAIAEDWIAAQVLDYLSANITRLAIEQDEAGRLWLVDNRGAFTEHPEQFATDQILSRIKRSARLSPALAAALLALDDRRLDAALRPGAYEQWLVYPRPLREVSIRARALGSWLQATNRAAVAR